MNDKVICKGCKGEFRERDVSEDHYCESCQYQHEQNLTHLASEQFNGKV